MPAEFTPPVPANAYLWDAQKALTYVHRRRDDALALLKSGDLTALPYVPVKHLCEGAYSVDGLLAVSLVSVMAYVLAKYW